MNDAIENDGEESIIIEARDERADEIVVNDGALKGYLRAMAKHPLLPAEETMRLATAARNGDTRAKQALVVANLRLVVKIAHEYRAAIKQVDELIQEGNVGLIHAVNHYDPEHKFTVKTDAGEVTRNVKFSSYAAYWIRAYILRYLINSYKLVKVGTTGNQRKIFFNLNKTKDRLRAMGTEPTHEAIANVLGATVAEVAEMDARMSKGDRSTDVVIGSEDGKTTFGDTLESEQPDTEALFMDAHDRAALREIVSAYRETLKNDKEVAILDERIMSEDPLTLQDLGDRFKVSRERMRQLEERVYTNLRDYLSDFA